MERFTCAQRLLSMGLNHLEQDNPQLLRAMAGLGYSSTLTGGICGAFTGGACLLGLYAGNASPDESANHRLPLRVDMLRQWFESYVGGTFGGVTCEHVMGTEAPTTAHCGPVLLRTYQRVMEILVQEGYDVGTGQLLVRDEDG